MENGSRDRMDGDFMAIVPKFLDMSVICILMTQEECGRYRTPVGISSVGGEYLLIDFPIFVVDRVVKGQDHHLRRLFRLESTRNQSAVTTAETVGKSAVIGITSMGSVGVVLGVTPRLV